MNRSAVIVPRRIAAQVGAAGAAMLPTSSHTYRTAPSATAPPPSRPTSTTRAVHRHLGDGDADRASTRRNIVSALKALARFLVDLGHISEDMAAPILALELHFKAEPKRPYLKSDEIEQAILALIADPEHDASWRLVNVANLRDRGPHGYLQLRALPP